MLPSGLMTYNAWVKVLRNIPEFRISRADFPKKVSLKMLNLADYNGFYNFVSVYIITNDHLNLNFFCRYTACFEI